METTDVNNLLNSVFTEKLNSNIKDVFEQKLLEYDISKTKALKLLNIDKNIFEEIINGVAKQPNLIHIIKIAEFINYDINEFIKIVLKNQSSDNIASLENARKTTFIVKNFDVKTLTNLGFIEKGDSLDTLIDRICVFFSFETIYHYDKELNQVMYSRTKKSPNNKMKDFWLKSSYRYFELINNPNTYYRQELIDLIPKIKPHTRNAEKGLLTVCQALFNSCLI